MLADDPSTKAENGVVVKIGDKELRDETGKPVRIHVDGITLDADSTFLYYHALTAHTLYRIRTRFLNDPLYSGEALKSRVERLSDIGITDGIDMDSDYNLYLTSPEDNAIKRFRIYDGSLVTLVRNNDIAWPVSICTAPLDYLYFPAAQFDRMPCFNNGRDRRIPPFKAFRIHRTLAPGS